MRPWEALGSLWELAFTLYEAEAAVGLGKTINMILLVFKGIPEYMLRPL